MAEEEGLLYRSPNVEEKNHDYSPHWDYEVDDEPDTELSSEAKSSSESLYSFLKEIGAINTRLFGFEVWSVKLKGNGAGLYVSGTCGWPVILLDLEKHREHIGAGQIYASIRHEIRHAVQESKDEPLDENDAEHGTQW